MNGILLYKSKYGATRQYADWIGIELRLPIIDPERMDEDLLASCDFVVIGSSVYSGELLLKSWMEENAQRFKHKKLFLFIVCAPAPDSTKNGQIILENIPGVLLRPSTDIFFMPGRWIFTQLSQADGRVLQWKALTEDDPSKKAALSQDRDAVKKENIDGLLGSVRSFASSIERRAKR